jgi:ABC-type multidrug transport system permease subunit
MPLPGRIALDSRPGTAPNPRSQAFILGGFIGFQALDLLTTHLGLALQHQELNRLMAPVISSRGELVAYAVKGIALAMLLAILMLMHRRKPRVWQAYLVAGWVSAAGVVANLMQLL